MEKVGFLTPNDDFIYMNYYEVEDFCKKICFQEENIKEFLKFSENYSYFSAYFDFVMIYKKYLFFNCLFNRKNFLIFFENAYYYSLVVNNKYKDNVELFKKNHKIHRIYSDLTTVMNRELDTKRRNIYTIDDCLIDPNMVGMMSKTNVGSDYGSHSVTAATVLNQLLIKSEILGNDFCNCIDFNCTFYANIPIEYLIQNLGFLRVGSRDTYPFIVANKDKLNEECLSFIQETIIHGYDFLNDDSCFDSKNKVLIMKEYQKCINKNKI